MASGSAAFDSQKSLFGGCERLLVQYRAIGAALKRYEHSCMLPGFSKVMRSAERELRISLSPIPVEVLESYLEDLLDLELEEGRLFIEQPGVPLTSTKMVCILAAFGILGGTLGLVAKTTPITSTLLGAAIALLFFLFCLSKHQTTRRMRFANLISKEANRRRGNPRDGIPRNHVMRVNRFSPLTPVH